MKESADEFEAAKLRPMHYFTIAACAFGFSFDMAEFAIGAIMSTIFAAPPYSVEPGKLSWLLSSVFIGAIFGAAFSGWLADRYGRRRVLLLILSVIVITSGVAAVSPNIESLIVIRLLSGLALGAYPPLMTTYLADVLPAHARGPAMMTTVAVAALGPFAMTFAVSWLAPLQPLGIEAWRWAFIIGVVVGIPCLYMFAKLVESPRWLAANGRMDEARAALRVLDPAAVDAPQETSTAQAASMPPAQGQDLLVRRLVFLVLLFFFTPWSTLGFPLLLGVVLVEKGFTVEKSLLFVGLSNLGPVLGALAVGFGVDKVERKTVLILCALLLMALGMLFGLQNNAGVLVSAGIAFNLLSAIFVPVLVLYAAEIVPTAQRARATSWAWAARGIGASLAPLLLVPLLKTWGSLTMFSVISVTLVGFILLLLLGPRGAAGQVIR
ncbi:MAG TPA: MFS transporter [Beijerinckiaceae bacterium]|jgi:putative MFS transporter|nr:MFS transporter [Beijerinckiaceae bacterium]